MDITSEKIISCIEKDYPINASIKNYSDLKFWPEYKYLHQYIVGLTHQDKFGIGINAYEHNMKNSLKGIDNKFIDFVQWPFRYDDLNDVKKVLNELSEYFSVELEIDEMVERLDVKKHKEETFFLVITVIKCPIVSLS